MSLPELKYHLEFECQHTLYECKRCTMKLKRMDVKQRHDDEECIEFLKSQVQELRQLKKDNVALESVLQKHKEKAKKQE